MKERAVFYRCNVCGNIVEVVKNGGGPLVCCGKPMEALVPNTVEASVEKHIPVAEHIGDTLCVKIGSAEHPMTEEHYIEWIAVTDGKTTERVALLPTDAPEAVFNYRENVKVYAYCNLHGLWELNV